MCRGSEVSPINLVHHLLVAEELRRALDWPERVRGQMLLGAIACDAHTEAPDLDRTFLHPVPGQDVVAYVTHKLTPPGALDDFEGRAFAVACIAHVVSDEITRVRPYPLPDSAPTGFVPGSEASATPGPHVLDLPAIRRDLRAAPARYALSPLTAAMIGAKRWEALDCPPLREGIRPVVAVEPLGRVVDEVVAETLRALRAGKGGGSLIKAPGRP